MGSINVGDIVARKSYGFDILFKVIDVKKIEKEYTAILKGLSYRIEADAPESDLIPQSDKRINEHVNSMNRVIERKSRDIQLNDYRSNLKKSFYRDTEKVGSRKFSRPGKVLHLDGDDDYLGTCVEQYKKFGIDVVGKHIQEKDQAASVSKLILDNQPDILVLTGHDGVIKNNNYLNISNYRNSKYFVDAVKEVRKYHRDLDNLVIFAGACQSMYKEILNAGANYASSPYRVLIHALDPVFVCQKVAFTSFNRILEPSEVIGNTITGSNGIGGIQTRGKYREGFPLEPYNQ
jgi:spore coat assemly protein